MLRLWLPVSCIAPAKSIRMLYAGVLLLHLLESLLLLFLLLLFPLLLLLLLLWGLHCLMCTAIASATLARYSI